MTNVISSDYNTIDVHAQGGILVTTSRNVAQVFGKEHYNVLKDIERTISQLPEEQTSNLTSGLFISSVYKTDPNGRDYPEYLITKDGLTLLVMGYTGEKAMAFKLAYIKRFNEMEQALKSQAERVSNDPLQQLMSRAQFLLDIVGIKGNQMALALDKVHKAKTGESLLALAGVQLIAPQQKQLLNVTQIGKSLGLTGAKVNIKLEELGLQRKTEAGWEPTEAGLAKGATMLDTGKRHSNGTPIRQLKWPSDILDNLD